jgi:hypothetical protein
MTLTALEILALLLTMEISNAAVKPTLSPMRQPLSRTRQLHPQFVIDMPTSQQEPALPKLSHALVTASTRGIRYAATVWPVLHCMSNAATPPVVMFTRELARNRGILEAQDNGTT